MHYLMALYKSFCSFWCYVWILDPLESFGSSCVISEACLWKWKWCHKIIKKRVLSYLCSNLTYDQAFFLFKGSDWVDASDATAIAEAELLSAANSIEAAARKLASLQPRLRPKVIRSIIMLEKLPFIAPDLLLLV